MSDADWQRAQDEWATARFRALGAPSPAQTNKWNREDEFRREQDADLAARCRAGTASVSEMLAYNRATNWTPSGIPLTDDSARINDAYAAIRAKLEEANG
jgi:hypothetical protein